MTYAHCCFLIVDLINYFLMSRFVRYVLGCTSQGNNMHPYPPYHFPLFPCDNLYISVQLFLHSLLIVCKLLSCIYLKYFSFDVIHQSTLCLLLVLLVGICRISLSDWLYTYLGGILKTRTVTVVERHC